MKLSACRVIAVALGCFSLPACNMHREQDSDKIHKIVVTNPEAKAVTITQRYVCQIHSRRHIQIRALESGYLEPIPIREGQSVKEGDVLFKVVPVIYQAKLDAELAERDVAQMKFNFGENLLKDKVVSKNAVSLLNAELSRAQAKTHLAEAELNFATIKAPFDGIVDRLQHQQGALVERGEALTSLSDNHLMWVYFNVPEASYLEYMSELSPHQDELKIELRLANGKKFPQIGKIGAIEAEFNNKTGNIPFRADFPNPDGLLRHGQTGNVLISRVQKDALVIPQRATFQVLDKRYVYVVDNEHVAHEREIVIENEMDDIFVIKSGLGVDDKIVIEGIRDVRNGEKVEYEDRQPENVFASLKYHAE
jgi:membrane fusion protein (multidrug efflux system)